MIVGHLFMQIAFRVDASVQIGTGHLMRCLTLANLLISLGHTVHFICRDLPNSLREILQIHGISFFCLSSNSSIVPSFCSDHDKTDTTWLGVSWHQDAQDTLKVLTQIGTSNPINWLVIDHYALDIQWEEVLRKSLSTKIMVIDDLANRHHDCDLLLDYNLYPQYQKRYTNLVPSHCKKLLGSSYTLLRAEFYHARQKSHSRTGHIRHILISFGGTDPTGETIKALSSIQRLDKLDLFIDVVIGSANQNRVEISRLCEDLPNATLHCQVNYMADLMLRADLAVASGGMSTWERCFLGLPSLTIAIAQNQVEALSYLDEMGVLLYLGEYRQVSVEVLHKTIHQLILNPSKMVKLNQAALKIMENPNPRAIISEMEYHS